MVKVARAVHYAHENGVLHRDLKPGNILLDNHGEPLVSDFGLARCDAVANYLTRSLDSFGTPGYIAPEQADGPASHLTAAADLYSLGAILFELLTSRPPFIGENAFAVMRQSAEERAPKVRTLAPHVDRDLEIICDRCLEREPVDRYQSAAELADDLQNWLDDRPIRARPPIAWRRTSRWVWRNRMLAASLSMLAMLTVSSLAWYSRSQKRQALMEESVLAQHSVVVLPFLDLDSVAGDPTTTQSVANLLRTELENLGPSRVITSGVPSWSRLDDLRKAAQEINGRTILTGTVRNIEGKKRISIRLLNPVTGKLLFASSFEEKDGAPKTGDWVRRIHALLNANKATEISPSDPGLGNARTRDFITAGQTCMSGYTVAGVDQAIDLFKKAVAEEPNSVLAHSLLAIAAITRTHFVADFSYLDLGKAESLKALALAPNSVDAHRARAGLYYQEGKFHEAMEEQLRIVEIGGVNERISGIIGRTLDELGRPDRSVLWGSISMNLQEHPGDVESSLGDYWMRLGDDERAFHDYDRSLELRPGSIPAAVGKAHLHLLRDEFDVARTICLEQWRDGEIGEMAQVAAQIEFFARNYPAAEELYSKLFQSDPYGGGTFHGAITYESALGRIRQAQKQEESADLLLKESLARETETFKREFTNPEAAYRVAAVEASLGLVDPAFQHLHEAVALGWLDYRSLQKDPRFDSLQGAPEFTNLIDGLSAKVAGLRNNVVLQKQ
jgi:tetratricopeptide (TPR) repeat protein